MDVPRLVQQQDVQTFGTQYLAGRAVEPTQVAEQTARFVIY
jgi:hypothetical protein